MPTTDTELKLRGAEIQIDLAAAHVDNSEIFRSCINSAVALGRSVTFVLQAESAHSQELMSWYNEAIKSHDDAQLLKYFNSQRVFTIHRGTIQPVQEGRQLWRVQSAGGSAIWGPQVITVWVMEGTEPFGLGSSVEAIALCRRYLSVLRQLVQAWLTKRDAA